MYAVPLGRHDSARTTGVLVLSMAAAGFVFIEEKRYQRSGCVATDYRIVGWKGWCPNANLPPLPEGTKERGQILVWVALVCRD